MQRDWFYAPAEPLYVGKHAKKIPEPISRAIPVWGTVEQHQYYAPQVSIRMDEKPETLKEALKHWMLEKKLGRKIKR